MLFKKILVAGGAGFIGSNIVEKLMSMEHVTKVIVLDNLSTGNIKNIEKYFTNPKFLFIQGDIRDPEICEKVCKNVEVVTCQAALGSVPRSMKNPYISHQNNVHGFATLLISAKKCGVKRFVYASSSSVYGNTKDENNLDHCVPISFYGITKHINDLYGSYFTKYFNMECIGLRYHNVFGKNQPFVGEYSAVIPIFIENAKNNKPLHIQGDGTQYRDFTHVSNVVKANLLSLTSDNKEVFGKSFDIGAGCKITINELAKIVLQETKSESSILNVENRPGDIKASFANMELSKKFINYSPKIDFITGIKKTISDF